MTRHLVALRATFTESYPAAPESVPVVRRVVADYAQRNGASDAQLEGIRLAVSEAVTNVVVHAYRGASGQIHVTAAAVPGELWLLVADDGCGFQTPPRAPGLGLGLALIAESSDEFTISERGQGGTEARMRFVLGDADGDAG